MKFMRDKGGVMSNMSMKVLFVDDDPELKSAYYHIDIKAADVATNIQAAINFLSHNKYDIMYLDYHLPDGTGSDILAWLSDNKASIPGRICSISFMPADPLFYRKIETILLHKENSND